MNHIKNRGLTLVGAEDILLIFLLVNISWYF